MINKTDNIAKRSAAHASATSSSSVPPDSTRDLTQGDVSTHLTRLTGFMVLSMMSFMVASLVETLYIGWVGTNELAAISFTFPVIYTLQGVSMGLGIGASSVVARSVGLGDHVRVRRVVTHVIVLGTTISLVMAFGTSFFLYDIFSLLGAEGVVLDLVVDYMWIWLIGLPVFTMTFVGTTLMRATGDAKTPGYLSALGSILHMAIAPFCIFGYGPIPAMGLEGAAISFIVARQLAFILFIYCFIFRDRMMGISMNGFFDSCRDILHVGLPAVASNMIMPFGMSVVTRLLAGHGVIVVAGYGVASRVESLLVMVIWAVGMSIAPLVGQNWGASAFNRVRTAMRLGGIFVMAWGGLCYATFYLLGEQMISLINDDPEVIHQAYTYLVIGTLAVGFMGLMNIATNSFNALGKPMPPLILSALQMVVLNIPIILIGDYIWGYRGIYAGGVLTSVVLSIVAWIWLHRTIDANSL